MPKKSAVVEPPPYSGPVTTELMTALASAWDTDPVPPRIDNYWRFAAVNKYLQEHRVELGLPEGWSSVTSSERYTICADVTSRTGPSTYVADLYALASGLVLIAHPGAMPYETTHCYNGVFECFNGLVVHGRNSRGNTFYRVAAFLPFSDWEFEPSFKSEIREDLRGLTTAEGVAGRIAYALDYGDYVCEGSYRLSPASWSALTRWLDRHLPAPKA